MLILNKDKKYIEFWYELEKDYEKEIEDNSDHIFGSKAVYIPYKRKINTRNLGGTIPDGFLIDFSDESNPEFYIVEIELSTHDFYSHIFPQITKFFAFFRNQISKSELIRKIFEIIQSDTQIRNNIVRFINNSEIFKFINDLITDSQNILLVIDEMKPEFSEIQETYTDTWGKYVKIINVKLFHHNNQEVIFLINPEFEDISYIANIEQSSEEEPEENSQIDENYHLSELAPKINDIYNYIKTAIRDFNSEVIFNPQKYYISIRLNKNVSYFIFQKKKVRIIIMAPIDLIRKKISHHEIKVLPLSVQRFYNGSCSSVEIIENENLDEVVNLIKDIIVRDANAR